ncbi:hypothetical protein DL769_002568 [Monosporascus sp. CRB-8-3]|nr:hypothetical protein DL769_002568 [Monosporascus sp. CRB-8-3]
MLFLCPGRAPRRPLPRRIAIGSAVVILLSAFILFTPSLSGIDLPLVVKGIPSLLGTIYSDVTEHKGQPGPTAIDRVTNDMLGFPKVFIVGLPERSNKRDAIALTSALTGFHVEWVDGVNGERISNEAAPFGVYMERLWNTNLGSWRGHMTTVRRIVEENLQSAMIMEDDMDWDTRLKSQLLMIAQGARELFPAPRLHPPLPPYGWSWDLLWLGHCGEVFPDLLDENKGKPADDAGIRYMSRKFTISDDPTVPDLDKVTGLIDFRIELRHTWWVHVTGAPICTFAYALSNRGARKVLLDLSVDHLTGPFDNALAGLCRRAVSNYGTLDPDRTGDRGLDTKCISVTPPIFFHHKAKGSVNADSDIQTVAGGEIREHGTTENIVRSARGNLRNMIMGTEMESQYD